MPVPIVGSVKLVRGGYRSNAIRHDEISAGVELLGAESFPPLALAVGLRQVIRIVTNALHRPFGMVIIGYLQPMPRMPKSGSYRKAQSALTRRRP